MSSFACRIEVEIIYWFAYSIIQQQLCLERLRENMNFQKILNLLVMFFHIYVRYQFVHHQDLSIRCLDTSTDLKYDGKNLHVSLIPNPSHLEVNLHFHPN